MKISKAKLKAIIKEELHAVLAEVEDAETKSMAYKLGKKATGKAIKKAAAELNILSKNPIPQKRGAFKAWLSKYGTRLPVIGRALKMAFLAVKAKDVLEAADKAYAAKGMPGVAAVLAKAGVGHALPVVGDALTLGELLVYAYKRVPRGPHKSKQLRRGEISARARGFI